MSEITKILILADKNIEQEIISSNYNKNLEFYSINNSEKFIQIDFVNYEQLAIDCKSLDIQLVIIYDINAIKNNATDVFKAYKINTVGVNKKFLELQTSKLFAKDFMKINEIRYPKNLQLFLPIFPAVIKKNVQNNTYKARILSNQEEKQKVFVEFGNDFFLEEYLIGEEISVQTFFNGKNLNFISKTYEPEQEKLEKLENILQKFELGLKSQNASFLSFLNIKILWAENKKVQDWYVIDFDFLNTTDINSLLGLVQNNIK